MEKQVKNRMTPPVTSYAVPAPSEMGLGIVCKTVDKWPIIYRPGLERIVCGDSPPRQTGIGTLQDNRNCPFNLAFFREKGEFPIHSQPNRCEWQGFAL